MNIDILLYKSLYFILIFNFSFLFGQDLRGLHFSIFSILFIFLVYNLIFNKILNWNS